MNELAKTVPLLKPKPNPFLLLKLLFLRKAPCPDSSAVRATVS